MAEVLSGGGEMGARMRSFDWSKTAVGEPASWPQSLKTIVRVMLDSRFAMWMSWGSEGTFFCNDAYLPTVGIKRDWVLGARSDRVWEEIWHDIGPRIQHVLATGQATWDQGLQLFLRRSGYDEETFHTFSYSPVYDESNSVAGMLCVVAEETERVLSERRLGVLHDLSACPTADATSMEVAGKSMLDVVARCTSDVPFAALYLTDDSTRRAALVGATEDPSQGTIPAVADFDDPSCRVGVAISNRREHVIEHLSSEIVLKGPWQDTLEQAIAIPLGVNTKRRPIGCLVVGVSTRRRLDDSYRSFLSLVADQFSSQLTDVDARLQAQKRAEALAELDRAKNVFFSNVSHEFRTPLTLMVGPLENLLARGDLSEAVTSELEMIQRNGLRLRKLVNSLLDFSRIEAGRVDVHFQPTNLSSLTSDIASMFRSAVEEAGLRFSVRCAELPDDAYVDREMWDKVVLNLLSNALKFTFEGEIAVELSSENAHARLSVRDTGVGIEPDQLPRVFERFHRVEGARSRSHEGTGIGLALVKELVRLHGGRVEVASEVGKGTEFTVSIPLGKHHLPADRVTSERGVTEGIERAAFLGDQASRKKPALESVGATHVIRRDRILVVDDNADMRSFVARLLQPYWTVDTAADGAEALEIIRSRKPDLVVSDMMMPNLDGRALIQHIRTEPSTHTLPVIVLSAQAGEEARVAGLNQGADDYLVKPFSAAELLARVEVQLTRANARHLEDARNKQLADIFREAPVGVAVLRGATHVFEFTNSLYQHFVGQRPVLGKPIRLALPELEGQGNFELLDKVYETGEAYLGHAFPVRLLDPATGQLKQHYFEFVYQPLPGTDDHASGIAIVGVDVTELMVARTQAETANRAKDEFIAMLGHELRNPLAPIATSLQVMAMRGGDTFQRERSVIDRQVKHMTRLVDDLLDVSRISRGNLDLNKTEVEMALIVDRAVETVEPLFEKRRQVLTVAVPRQGLRVLADPIRLSQVISNVLTNAAKFTGDAGKISIAASVEQEEAILTIADDGVGMTPDELTSVFGLFVQGSQGLNRALGGLGLGLTIAQNLARLHGGSLLASSDGPGRGSEFQLRMPLVSNVQGSESARATEMTPTMPAFRKRRVMLVDDNEDALALLGELLEVEGHEVITAEDGPSAMRLLNENGGCDVAVLDIGLPVMSGYELAQHIRNGSGGQDIRLIALTGYGQVADLERTKRSGFDTHLVKPVDIGTLLQAIDRASSE